MYRDFLAVLAEPLQSPTPHRQGGKDMTANLLCSSIKSSLYAGNVFVADHLSISRGGMHRAESKQLWVCFLEFLFG